MISKILAASDGSTSSMEAARAATVIAGAFGAKLTIVTVAYIPRMYKIDLSDEMERAYVDDWEHVLKDTLKVAGEAVQAETKLLRGGTPAEAILDEAKSGGYDLIVMGSRGADNPGDKGMGSVATRVGAQAHCSVLVIR